ncbi:L-histidine N(alpha)-methyltransferase [Aestuariirhabdus litorea]|uniref:L-histidine N(Alpha)-methyltransferase n=1 Tax=Aestuariirhabdus litorea TaxID=2528527 RepID=A0A3P3VJF2_9GAMM|nr:L-histidine N(alpha)-methyltransferase [Aestuariirhabdus litorea]RRJ82840.1 L-histidine N(alpha)-methyltransferase [Aestuariirhabdus litorea]RWW92999.1 L-histidine N(alpha)-methyltransferase [Endozoicomonadaceae bacterium GTF-13]
MSSIHFHDLHSQIDRFAEDVIAGLSQRPATLAPKYFYDERGSALFEAITELPEYYPTRTEIGILRDNAADIAREVGSTSLLVEPGGGSLAKVRILLEGLRPLAYVPMDISRDHLRLSAAALAEDFPWLEIHATCTDYSRLMQLPASTPTGTTLAFFPGSSIGNFDPPEAVRFLRAIAELVGPGGYLLIGVDLKKESAILEAAYDDAAGVTAAFNLNLLTRINRELEANFNLPQWRHRAFYNPGPGRIEMHLLSLRPQQVVVEGHPFHFKEGETIHTENSYKYSGEEFATLAGKAGFHGQALWSDPAKLFSVHLLRVASTSADAPPGQVTRSYPPS